ncbi:MAG: HD-GYP domain-containing protein [Lachnospiraceae bacterium]|nr:HD-GYP domain-containing protein [Lachnospiraceae bacterium]
MEYCRLQIGCLLIVVYIGFKYFQECKRYHKKLSSSIFDEILILSVICIFFDGMTGVTVNNLDTVNPTWNKALHLLFLIGIDSVVYMMFGYMLKSTGALPVKKRTRLLLHIPYIINVMVVVINIGELEFRNGTYSNYSMGISAYTCFAMVGTYVMFTLIVFFKRWNYIESNKRLSILTYLLAIGGITIVQAIFPEILLSSVAVTIMVIGVYLNQEDPTLNEISRYHSEMVMSFAILVENKDGSTGGHIKRTTAYVKLLAEELRSRGYYREFLTKDYIKNLCQSAPMHDIGKIAVPDVILQKPGKLTQEEYEIIKKHTSDGGKIIKETFGNLGDAEYTEMAYQVARYHHEKWNGKGYPEGLRKHEIPLCARIMAVADVFDAVSEKRCYRDAMSLEQCFAIISEGSGQDFEPIITKVFLDSKEKVEQIHSEISTK